MPTLLSLLLLIFAIAEPTIAPVPKEGRQKEFQDLVAFVSQFGYHSWDPSWDSNQNSCSWRGILCRKGRVWGLKLENMGLHGSVRLAPIMNMMNVKTLSMMNNELTGPFPNISLLPEIKSVYFSGNRIEGVIPPEMISYSGNLKKLHFASNRLTGVIPEALARLPSLKELKLENNGLHGSLPDFKNVRHLNVSYNLLSGPIPASLSFMDSSSFIGNPGLCGPPSSTPCGHSVTESAKKGGPKQFNVLHEIGVLVIAILATAVLALVFVIIHNRSRTRSTTPLPVESPATSTAASGRGRRRTTGESPQESRGGLAEPGKLCFVREGEGKRFELTDLLRASAEILRGEGMGSSYKAAVLSGPVVVVKRYRQMNNLNKEEFHEHMRHIGSLNHPNLMPLVAYYYRKEEKLLVTEFVNGGNLALRLHGGTTLPKLDWPARLKILKGVAKGLWYLYNEFPNLETPHGHLKSTNILLSRSADSLLTDYALLPIANHDYARHFLIAYHSPEFHHLNQITRKTDVWALGLIILETLIGSPPPQNASSDGDSEYFRVLWVASVRKAVEGSADVLDRTMGKACEGEMGKMLKIAMGCCEEDLGKRMAMKEAVERIGEVGEYRDEFFSTRCNDDLNI